MTKMRKWYKKIPSLGSRVFFWLSLVIFSKLKACFGIPNENQTTRNHSTSYPRGRIDSHTALTVSRRVALVSSYLAYYFCSCKKICCSCCFSLNGLKCFFFVTIVKNLCSLHASPKNVTSPMSFFVIIPSL